MSGKLSTQGIDSLWNTLVESLNVAPVVKALISFSAFILSHWQHSSFFQLLQRIPFLAFKSVSSMKMLMYNSNLLSFLFDKVSETELHIFLPVPVGFSTIKTFREFSYTHFKIFQNADICISGPNHSYLSYTFPPTCLPSKELFTSR